MALQAQVLLLDHLLEFRRLDMFVNDNKVFDTEDLFTGSIPLRCTLEEKILNRQAHETLRIVDTALLSYQLQLYARHKEHKT